MSGRAGRLAVAALLAGCAARRAAPPPAPEPTATAGLMVALVWAAPVDLDLYVTDPALETAYYANPRTASGGVLERDARCADGPAPVAIERARWTAPPPGRYRVGVDYPEACTGTARPVPFRLVVDVDGRRRELVAEAAPVVRAPRVLEFTVPSLEEEGPP